MTEEHDSGLQPLEALRGLNTIATAFMVAQTFGTASNLGIFEFLKGGPATVEDISEQARIHPDGGRRLLAALREIGLVEPSDGQFRNSALGAFLTSESPAPLEPLSMWSTVFARMWEHLPDALRECGPRVEAGAQYHLRRGDLCGDLRGSGAVATVHAEDGCIERPRGATRGRKAIRFSPAHMRDGRCRGTGRLRH